MTAYSGYIKMTYYPSGDLKSYKSLVDDYLIVGGLEILAMINADIEFYQSGSVKRITPAEDIKLEFEGKRYCIEKENEVRFFEDGQVENFIGRLDTSFLNYISNTIKWLFQKVSG